MTVQSLSTAFQVMSIHSASRQELNSPVMKLGQLTFHLVSLKQLRKSIKLIFVLTLTLRPPIYRNQTRGTEIRCLPRASGETVLLCVSHWSCECYPNCDLEFSCATSNSTRRVLCRQRRVCQLLDNRVLQLFS